MRLVVDARGFGWTGIGRYTRRLLEHLAPLDRESEYIVLLGHEDATHWTSPGPNFSPRISDARPYRWEGQVLLPRQLRDLRPDLVHFPHFNVPVAYRDRFVVTIHDTTMLRFPIHCDVSPWREPIRRAKRTVAGLAMSDAVRRAHRVITPSQFTADDVGGRFEADPARTVVIRSAVDPPVTDPEPVPGISEELLFLLYVGNAYPHKNLGTLIAATRDLLGDHPELCLVIAGPPDECSQRLRSTVHGDPVGKHVKFVGRVSDRQLSWLYLHATIFVLPSFSEGFGLTGLEAMAHGTPVVAARATCLPEIYGEAAQYFEPLDRSDLVASLEGLLGDEARRATLSKAGTEQSALYSWDAMARATLETYRI
ncbi:MAG TPA: glycosyltransferase family 1 protein [Acidimicrobiales bacterium]|nr:glycosyltransferase family 1 protein [Acidimicrobiales bacterium]